MSLSAKVTALREALEKAPFFCQLAGVLVSGIALSFIQAPYHLWFLLFPCFGLYYFFFANAESKKEVFVLTFVFAIGYFVTGLNWIGNALLVEGNDYWWVWPIAVIALPTLLSLFTALYATISHIVFRKDTLTGLLGFCALFTLSEWVRGYAFTGFPWNLYGYGWISVLPMAQSVSLIGPYGLTLLTVFWGVAIGYIASKKFQTMRVLYIVILSLAITYVFGLYRLSQPTIDSVIGEEAATVHIVQPNIAQADKWKTEKLASNFEKLVELSAIKEKGKKNIIVWPETSLPPVFLNNAAVSQRIRSQLDSNTILLGGALETTRTEEASLYHNSLMLWDRQTKKPERLYSKSHLVPLGEYIPFQKYIPLKPVAQFSGFEHGSGAQTIGMDGYPSVTSLICYEIIFPHQVTNKHQIRPDYILTITNDAWYGDSPGPRQHFVQARFRAIEQGLPVIRSANTGISGIIGPYGHILEKLPLMEEGSITAKMPSKASKTYYGMYGDKIFLGMLLICFLLGTSARKK